jgi:hypothetical protein
MNPTLRLLRFIGSPFVANTLEIDGENISELDQVSLKNRIRFLFLETLREKGNLGDLETIYAQEKKRCAVGFEAMCRVSKILADSGIQYALFKTIRPYTFTTVDIDIVIFGDGLHFWKAVESLQMAGYNLAARGPSSCTLRDPKANLGVDLYKEIAVSFLTYMDKRKLNNFVTVLKLGNGGSVKSLKPEADLASIIAHSVIKEQMYTLSEYYTFVHYLKKFNVQSFLEIVKQNNLVYATRTHLSITAFLHRVAHEFVPEELQQILDVFGEENMEKSRLIGSKLETPHKYHPITVARSLLEIAKGKEVIKSVGAQLIHMLNPNISRDFLIKLVNHVRRETY